MRPLERLNVGDLLSNGETIQEDYASYQDAKPALAENFGEYCSFCERPVPLDYHLAVEHIVSKKKHPEYKTKWTNFLLSCGRCNGIKDEKDTLNAALYLPDRNNLLCGIEYCKDGRVVIQTNIPTASAMYEKTKNLIELVGLDRSPNHQEYKSGDDRHKIRRAVYEQAEKCLKILENNPEAMELILDLAKAKGHFSIWFQVFRDYPNFRLALIQTFAGTHKDSFDSSHNYEPIYRNPPTDF